jgi:hypothetical protein
VKPLFFLSRGIQSIINFGILSSGICRYLYICSTCLFKRTCFEITIGSKQLVLIHVGQLVFIHVGCKCARVMRELQLQWRTADESLCGPFIQQPIHGTSVEINPVHEAAKWITAGFCRRNYCRQSEHLSQYKWSSKHHREFNNSAGYVKSIPFFVRFLFFPFSLSLSLFVNLTFLLTCIHTFLKNKEFCVLRIQSNTTIFHLVVQ